MFDDLFAPEVVVRFGAISEAAERNLRPAEEAQVSRSVGKRRAQYATGRSLARAALHELGFGDFTLVNGEDRSPRWPDGVAGTISHCDSLAVAAVGLRRQVGTLGVDVEHRSALKEELWPHTLLPEERRALAAHPPPRRGALALICFSAKEALYKAQYPRTRRYMGFHALRVDLLPSRPDAPSASGRLRCVFTETVGAFDQGFVATGHYRRAEGAAHAPLTATAVTIPP